jgi:hypothetical protein
MARKKKYDDLFGLGGFGAGMMDDMLGSVVGGGVSTVAAIGARMASGDPTVQKYSEGIGAAVGVAAGAAMYFGTSRKSAGLTAMVTAAVTGGLRQLERLLASPAVAGFGLPTIAPTVAFAGSNFGIATIDPTVAFAGFGNSPQLVGPPQLVGADAGVLGTPGAQQLPALQGPAISGLAGAYGATLFGSSR